MESDPLTPAGLIWEHRPDGVFIQIPPMPGEREVQTPDHAFFPLLIAFAIVTIVVIFGYSEGMPIVLTLLGLLISVILAALLVRGLMKKKAIDREPRLPATIEISSGYFSIDAPHIPFRLRTPAQGVRDLCACVSEFEGFGVGLHGVRINTGYNVRITVELINNVAHDVMIKCDLDKRQVLQLEMDLRDALGLPKLKPP